MRRLKVRTLIRHNIDYTEYTLHSVFLVSLPHLSFLSLHLLGIHVCNIYHIISNVKYFKDWPEKCNYVTLYFPAQILPDSVNTRVVRIINIVPL